MGHISQAWTNLAPPSANFFAARMMESFRACGDRDHLLFQCRTRLPAADAEQAA